MREDYVSQIIKDRVEDVNMRIIYKKIMEIVVNNFSGEVSSQQELIEKLNKELSLGRNKCLKLIDNLIAFGLLNVTRGGRNNSQKILKIL